MEEQQFVYLATLLQQQLQVLETMTSEIVRLNTLLQQVFMK